jgi:hypothetical protein
MKQVFLIASLLILVFSSYAQNDSYDDLQLQLFNQERLTISKKNMLVLGGWSIANMTIGGVLSTQTEGSTKYFHQMNAIWNIVNLGITAGGYFGIRKELNKENWTLSKTVTEQHKIQKILLFNAGLDLAYIATGVYLIERSKNDLENQDRWKGFGQGLILQGGFLFVFDIVQNQLHQKHGKKLSKFLENTSISVSPVGFSCVISF